MLDLVEDYLILFFVYSFIGWSIEVVREFILIHKFVNRGFLIGPICPIYGCGGLLITFATQWSRDNLVITFLIITVLCGILEYLTGYFLEKAFGARWWDYSEKKLNINGRVCAETLVPFGVLGSLAVYFGNPFLLKLAIMIPGYGKHIIAMVFLIIFIADWIISYAVVKSLKGLTHRLKDDTQEISEKVLKLLKTKLHLHIRLVKAFPALDKANTAHDWLLNKLKEAKIKIDFIHK